MTRPRRTSANVIAAATVLLTASWWPAAAARAQVAPGTIDDNAAIFIDGRTFQVVRGASTTDATADIEMLGARPLGPAAIVFRAGGKLYVARAPLRLAASADGPDAYVTADEGPRVHIAYAVPKNRDNDRIYRMIKDRRALEKARELISPFRLPEDLDVRAVECDGVANTYYFREQGRPTISLCYEYFKEVEGMLPSETTMDGITAEEALVGQLMFAALHEFGHAAFDIYHVPIFGRQEDAADQFATYIMLQFGGEKAHRLIRGAAYSYLELIRRIKEQAKANVTVPLAAFASEHGAEEQRFYNMACLAYGYDPKVFAAVVNKDYLPERRAEVCRYEYGQLSFAFRTLVLAHVDMAVAARVRDEDWLPAGPVKSSSMTHSGG